MKCRRGPARRCAPKAALAAGAIAAVAAFSLGQSARAAEDAACARYEEPLAYNACLARNGPKANGVGMPATGSEYPLAAKFRAGKDMSNWPATATVRWTRGGQRRVHMEFTVK